MIFSGRLQSLRDRFDRLSQRERTLVGALGVTFIVLLTLVVGFLITDGLSSMEERNAGMRQALKDIDLHRDAYLRQKARTAQLESRLGRSSMQLGGFLEQCAKDAGVDIPESNERPPAQAGKQYVEHATDLRLTRVKLDALVDFMRRIETGPNMVVVSALSVHVRDDHHQELDVEMTVSTWERATLKPSAKKGDKT